MSKRKPFTPPRHITIKILLESRRVLRMISAARGETLLEVVRRLAEAEWNKIGKEKR